MKQQSKREIILISVVVILLMVFFISTNTSAKNTNVTGNAIYDTLSAEQKQAYWECFKTNKCSELLAAKKNKEYRVCSLSCNKQAKTATENVWCEDSDGGDNFLKKGIVKSNIYVSGKEDSCYAFPNGKTYLFEGRCNKNKYQYMQKSCTELGNEYLCKEGVCIKEGQKKICYNDDCSISCTDTDWNDSSSDNLYKKGTLTIGNEGKIIEYEDMCSENGDEIAEFYCPENPEDESQKETVCPSEYTCEKGACVEIKYATEGDGTYLVGEGEIITAKNGISLKVIKIVENEPNFFQCCGTHKTYYDIYIGSNKINLLPQVYQWNKYDNYLTDWAVKIEIAPKHMVKDGKKKVVITFTSVEDGPITSCEDLYDLCLGYGYKHGTCKIYCADEPLEKEVVKVKEDVTVFVDPLYEGYGEYIADQTFHCKEKLKEIITINPYLSSFFVHIYPANVGSFVTGEKGIDWTVFPGGDVDFYNSQQPKGFCDNPKLVHELVHYFMMPFPVRSIINEGFATYMQHKTGILDIPSLGVNPEGVNGEIKCGDKGFKGLSIGDCYITCAIKNCEYSFDQSQYIKVYFSESTTYNGYSITSSSLGNYVYEVTIQKGEKSITKKVPQGKDILFDSHIFLLGDLYFHSDKGEGIGIAIIENSNPACYQDCSVQCPVTNEDGSIAYTDLSEGYVKPHSHAYATAYCFFQEVEDIFGFSVIKEFQQEAKQKQMEYGSLCMPDYFPSIKDNLKYKEIALKYVSEADFENNMCGFLGIIKSGDQWTNS